MQNKSIYSHAENDQASQQSAISQREMECLYWLARGKTQEQIASILKITLRTVKAHISNSKQKLNCYNQFQLGMTCMHLNLTGLG